MRAHECVHLWHMCRQVCAYVCMGVCRDGCVHLCECVREYAHVSGCVRAQVCVLTAEKLRSWVGLFVVLGLLSLLQLLSSRANLHKRRKADAFIP